MAIQMRRGAKTDFDPTKMLPGEWAVMLSGDDTTDGYAVYMCYAAGVVRRLVDEQEIAALPQNIIDEIMAEIEAEMTAVEAATAAALAAIEAMGDISELAVPEMSANIRGGAKLGDGLSITDGVLSVDGATIDLPTMSATTKGGAKLGAGLAIVNGALELDGSGDIATAVDAWLDAHPEATTTVQDGAVTTVKLADGAVTDAKLAQTGGVLSDVSDLKNNLSEVANINYEWLANKKAKWINTNDVEGDNANLRCSDFVRIPNNAKTIEVANRTTIGANVYHITPCVIFYDANKAKISHSTNNVDDIVSEPIPSGAVYVRFNQSNTGVDTPLVRWLFFTLLDAQAYTFSPLATYNNTFTARQQLNTGIALEANTTYIINCAKPPTGRINVYCSANTSTYKSFTPWRNTIRFTNGGSSGTLMLYNPESTLDEMDISVYEADSTIPKINLLPSVYVVDKMDSQNGDYTSFTECLLALKDDDTPKIIYINGGDYDICQEYEDANIPVYTGDNPSMDYWDYNVRIPNNTHIIGRGLVRLLWMPEPGDVTPNQSKTVSPVNVAGTMTLENVEIHCKNGRYCIHDDPLGKAEYTNAIKKYVNVKCYKYANAEGYGFAPVIGFGIDSCMHYEFENCRFINYGNERAFYMHNRASSGGSIIQKRQSSDIVVNNCILNSGTNNMVAKFGNGSGNTYLRIRVDFNNCSFNNNVISYIKVLNEGSETSETYPNTFDITLNRCSPNVQVQVADGNNMYPPLIVQ